METISPLTDILDGDKIVSLLSKNYYEDMIPSMFLLIGKILSLSFVNIKMEIMSLLYYLLNRGIMSLETMSPSAMGIRTYGLIIRWVVLVQRFLTIYIMLSEIDFLTLSMGMGLKLPSFINPNCG